MDFDDYDDDDDDERPLIIVTDTPSSSATPMDTDMAEGESGVTIISHPKTLGSKSSGGDTEGGSVGKLLTPDVGLLKFGSSTQSSSNSKRPGTATSKEIGVSSVPSTCATSSSGGASSLSQAAATASQAPGCSLPQNREASAEEFRLPEQPCSSTSARPQEQPKLAAGERSCPDHAKSQNVSKETGLVSQTKGEADTKQLSEMPRSAKPLCSDPATQPSSTPCSADTVRPDKDVGRSKPTPFADDGRPSDLKHVAESSCPSAAAPQAESAQSSKSSCSAEAAVSVEQKQSVSSASAGSSCPVDPSLSPETKAAAAAASPHSAACQPSKTPSPRPQPSRVKEPSPRKQADVLQVSQASEQNLSKAATELPRPSESATPTEVPVSSQPEPPHESPRAAGQSGGEGSSGSKFRQNSGQRDDDKREVRHSTTAKTTETVPSDSGRSKSSSSSTMGIFERIYTVTSNCTASGIKSIFKTTAIVPATAARRYSDVSGSPPVTGLGERRASTGGDGGAVKSAKDRVKVSSEAKHKSGPSRDNRSSLDALAHLTKSSLFGAAHVSKNMSHKDESLASATASPRDASAMPKAGDKRPSASSASADSGSTDKRPSNPSNCNGSDRKQCGSDTPTTHTSENKSSVSKAHSSENRPSVSKTPRAHTSENRPSLNKATDAHTLESRPSVSKATSALTSENRSSVSKASSAHTSENRPIVSTGAKPTTPSKLTMSGTAKPSEHGSTTPNNRNHDSVVNNKQNLTAASTLFAGELRVKLPKCSMYGDSVAIAGGQNKQRLPSATGNGTQGSSKGTSSKSAGNVRAADSVHKLKPASGACDGKPPQASDVQVKDQDKRTVAAGNPVDRPLANSDAKQKPCPASNHRDSGMKKEESLAMEKQLTTTKTESVVSSVVSSPVSSSSSLKMASSSTSSSGDCKEKGVSAVSGGSSKGAGGSSSVDVKHGISGAVPAAKASEAAITAGVKRPHSAISTSGSKLSSVQPFATSAGVRFSPDALLVMSSAMAKLAGRPGPHSRLAGVGSDGGPEAKKLKLSANSQFSMSPLIAPTILSSSAVVSSGSPAHRLAAGGVGLGAAAATSSMTSLSCSKPAVSSKVGGTAGLAKIRPVGSSAVSCDKTLAPGQRVNSLLLRATSRLAAASAVRPVASSMVTASATPRKSRSESVDSRMTFINKTFGGGKSSKETCVSPAASRGEINFSARHILSPNFHSHGAGAGRMSATSSASSSKASLVTASSKASLATASIKHKNTDSVCDLSTRPGAGEGAGSRDGGGGDGGPRSGTDNMKLDIQRLSSSSRDSVFASDPECSPTPSPKYSDINRNPIKLEPGSKLCRKETWVSAENGGRRSTGSVGSPNSLGSGPGSPLETDRSPARDARRPSDSELLLSQRWHGLHPHPHPLAIPHPAAAAAVAAAAALYNGRFKVPSAASFLPLATDHMPRSSSPDPMPLDYSTTSSSSSSSSSSSK